MVGGLCKQPEEGNGQCVRRYESYARDDQFFLRILEFNVGEV